MEHTQVLHSVRMPARMSARSEDMDSPFSTLVNSTSLLSAVPTLSVASGSRASGGPGMKKHGCTRPAAPITAENSGALQRTWG